MIISQNIFLSNLITFSGDGEYYLENLFGENNIAQNQVFNNKVS
jgi:hypothetical protein